MDRIRVVLPVPGPPVITDTLWARICCEDRLPVGPKGRWRAFFSTAVGDHAAVRWRVGGRNGLHGGNPPGDNGFPPDKGFWGRPGRRCRRSPPARRPCTRLVQGGGGTQILLPRPRRFPGTGRRACLPDHVGVALIHALVEKMQQAGLGPVCISSTGVSALRTMVSAMDKPYAGDTSLGHPIRIVAQDVDRVIAVFTQQSGRHVAVSTPFCSRN